MKKRRMRPAALLSALLLCAALCGCAGTAEPQPQPEETEAEEPAEIAAEPEEGFLRIGVPSAIATMDVHRTSNDYLIPLNIFERLFEIRIREDGSTELVKGLAEDWSVSEDGLTYSFTLRDDAYFSDGTKVTASDVAFTFTRMLSLQGSAQTDFADMILGADAVMAHKATSLEGVRVLDERRLEVTLAEPFAGYLYQLATPGCSILSKAAVTKAGAGFGTSAEQTIGSGPYMVTEFTSVRIELEKNPYYHCREGEELSVEKAEILVLPPALIDRNFRSGNLDLLDTLYVNPDTVTNVYKTGAWEDRLVSRSCVETRYLMLNVDEGPLKDVRVRRAVQLAIDRQRILDELFDGDGSLVDGIYPKGLIGYSEASQGWLRHDPEEAARLIDEVPGAKDVRLEIAADSQSDVRILSLLEMIRQDLSDVGLNVSIVSYDSDSWLYLRKAGRLMAYTGVWSADFNDPDNFIYTFFGSRDKTRFRSGNYADEAVIGRIAAARTIQDEGERLAEYAALEKLLVQDEAVWVPLFSTDHLFVLGDRVESFNPFWAGWSDMYLKDVVLRQTPQEVEG